MIKFVLFLALLLAFSIASAQEIYETYSEGNVSILVKPSKS